MGINCAQCKHKSAVAKHFKIALFSVAPSMDPKMRAMYHFIALEKVLPSHMYRNLGDCQNEPEIDSYIQNIGKHSKGNCEEDDLPTASSAFYHRVIPCQICMKILDPFKNVIFVSYHHN